MAHGRLSYQGRVVNVPNLEFHIPLPERPVPIYLAALGPNMAALAGEIADGVLFNMGTPEYLAEAIGGLKDAARRAGRDPSQVDVAYLALAGIGSSGEALCRRMIARYLRLPFYESLLRNSGLGADVDKVMAAMREGGSRKAGLAVSDRMVDDLAMVETRPPGGTRSPGWRGPASRWCARTSGPTATMPRNQCWVAYEEWRRHEDKPTADGPLGLAGPFDVTLVPNFAVIRRLTCCLK